MYTDISQKGRKAVHYSIDCQSTTLHNSSRCLEFWMLNVVANRLKIASIFAYVSLPDCHPTVLIRNANAQQIRDDQFTRRFFLYVMIRTEKKHKRHDRYKQANQLDRTHSTYCTLCPPAFCNYENTTCLRCDFQVRCSIRCRIARPATTGRVWYYLSQQKTSCSISPFLELWEN